MNAAQWHLALNHVPIVGTVLVVPVLAWGLVRRSRDLLRVALALTVVLGAVAYPVVRTGKSAEEMVKEAVWADETLIHEHEERGEIALIAVLVTGALAAVALWLLRGNRETRRLVPGITLVTLLLSSGLLAWTALAGGEIRHDEVRGGAAISTQIEEVNTAEDHDEEARDP